MKNKSFKNEIKDVFTGTIILSVLLLIFGSIFMLPGMCGMYYYEWQEELLETAIEHWPIFIGAIVGISFLYSLFEMIKKLINNKKFSPSN